MKDLEQLKEQYKKLGEEIERLERDEPWKPKEDEKYYAVDQFGVVVFYVNFEDCNDMALVDLGNCFRIEEEANLRAAQYRAFMKMMKHADGGEWRNYYYSYDGSVDQDSADHVYPEHPMWFSTREKAVAALEELTEEEKNAWFKGKL